MSEPLIQLNPYPTTIFVAGVLWSVASGFFLLNMFVCILAILLSGADFIDPFLPREVSYGLVVFWFLFFTTFLKAGLGALRGNMLRLIGDVVGSLGIGGIIIFIAYYQFQRALSPRGDAFDLLQGLLTFSIGAILAVAAFLALIGEKSYQRWKAGEILREAQKDVATPSPSEAPDTAIKTGPSH